MSGARFRRFLANAVSDKRSGVALLAATVIGGMLFFGGMSIDFGLVLFKKRQLQAATDRAAMAAAQNLTNGQTAATQLLAANGFASARITSYTAGAYVADSAVPVGQRFVAGAAPANAVQVMTAFDVKMPFVSAIVPNAMLTVPAIASATRVNEAGISAGSGLASLNGGLPNALLGAMLGSNLSLDLVSYNGLANADLDALDFLDALAARVHLTAGTYNQLLASSVSVSDILAAEATALASPRSIGSTQAAIAGLGNLAASLTGSPGIVVGQLVSAGLWGTARIGAIDRSTALAANINAFDTVSFIAQVANGSNLLQAGGAVNILGLGLAPIASVSVATALVAPPAFIVVGPVGAAVHTAQVRLLLTIKVLQGLSILGIVAPLGLQVVVEAASGSAAVTSIACSNQPGTDSTVGVTANASLATATLGSVDPATLANFSVPLRPGPTPVISLLGLATVSAYQRIQLAQSGDRSLSFSRAQITALTPQTISSTGMTQNLFASLLTGGALSITGLPPLGLLAPNLALVGSLVFAALSPVFAGLDSVVDQTLSTLGIKVGYLDVTVTGVRCGVPALFQ